MRREPRLLLSLFILPALVSIAGCTGSFERDLTINVDPGKADCFYQLATEKQTIDLEFQVIDGTRGSLDVGFQLSAPGGRILVSLSRRQAGVARAVAPATGDYRFCFDNTHSTISSKTVYFDLLIDSDEDVSEENSKEDDAEDNPTEGHDDLMEAMNRVGDQLAKVRRLQEASAARSSRDDHAAARSLSRVTVCSASNAIAVLVIGILQVVLLRSLFDEKSKVRDLWKKMPFSQNS